MSATTVIDMSACPCCPASCPICSGGLPKNLHVTFSGLGACDYLTNGTAYPLTYTPGVGWVYTCSGCDSVGGDVDITLSGCALADPYFVLSVDWTNAPPGGGGSIRTAYETVIHSTLKISCSPVNLVFDAGWMATPPYFGGDCSGITGAHAVVTI